jgi:hypothetical protein
VKFKKICYICQWKVEIGVSYIKLVVCQHIRLQTLDRSVSSCLINKVDFVRSPCLEILLEIFEFS